MGLEELLAAQQRIVEMLRAEGKAHGGLMASALQLVDHLSAKLAGQVSELEHTIQIKVEGQSGVMERVADQFVQSMEGMLMRETKTAGRIYDAFAKKHMEQLELDMIAAIFGIQQRWRLASEEDLADSENYRVKKLQEAQKLLAETYGWTQAEFRVALSNFGFEDSLRELVMAPVERLVAPVGEITKKAQEDLHQGIDETLENFDEWIGDALRPAIDETFSEDGPLTQDALKAVRNSPDFGPAMEVLFGPDGTLAQAARGATEQANLEPALDGFEEKIESGVTAALDEAGTKAQAHAVASLGSKVKEGVGALGGALSAVGGLGTSVIALGAAWDKPNKGAADYFGLMSQLGGTISQGLGAVDAIAKLAGVTKIAAAAQAVFNAVMAINPVVLIVIAVVALIAALALLIIYWDQVKAAVRDNPWIGIAVVLLGIIAPIFGIIAAVIMLIAYWDEVKLAFLQGANFMSIQLQKIGGFFLGLQNLIGMVWDWIVASVYNLGAGIINGYIEFGAGIINFFVGLINSFIGIFNDLADVVPGLDRIAEVERVNVEAIKVASKEVPEIDVGKAFARQGEITGGLEAQIVKQEEVVKKAQEEDKVRRDQKAQENAEKEKAEAAAAGPAAGMLPAAVPQLPAPGALAPAGVVPSGGAGDQSIHIEGGIQISINAERLEADSAKLLTDEMVRQLQERLDSLRSERDRRVGIRAAAFA